MDELLTARLAAVSRSHAQREALVDGAKRFTYEQLWTTARTFAGFLLARGLTRGAPVALILPNGFEAVAAVYGTWLAGGVAVPLNVQARGRDFQAWLRHCEPEIMVFDAANGEARQAGAEAPKPCVRLTTGSSGPGSGLGEWSWLQVVHSAPLPYTETPQRPTEPAMILYTSGTTGAPKGVTLSHGNLAANVAAVTQYLQLTAADSVVSLLPFYYSYGASVLHTHLAVGARVVLEHSMAFPHTVVESIVRERATGFSGVPSTYALLLSRVDLGNSKLGSLRYLTQAGGAMPDRVTLRLLSALPDVRLFVMYGQTEATARLTYLHPDRLREKLGSVGTPIAGMELQVRDAEGREVPAGESGEIWARGSSVMLGYWRDPEATASTLRAGWLRTGDLGFIDADGYLFLAGRRSDMIKTGAHRVNPRDIEEAVAEIDGIEEVAAVGIDDELLGQAIKVCVVLAPGAHIDAQAIRRHCRERLAVYKVPKQVEFVASLPRTAAGKVRRFELAASRVHSEGYRD